MFVFGLTWLLATVRRDQPRRVADLLACLLTAAGFAVATHSPQIAVLGGPLMFFLLLVAANRVRGGKERVYAFLLAVGLVALLAAMLLPALATGGKGTGAIGGKNEVQVLDRKIVGIFDTTTIAAKESEALAAWLTANGFAVGADARPVIDELVRDGWVFVATKVHRESDRRAPATPHPLSFTFKSAKPVYPLRLTGVGNTRLTLELFVVGTERADIKGFKVTECREIEPGTHGGEWQSRGFKKLKHPQFLAWTGNASVITRLEAKLNAADMRQDARVTWQGFRNTRSRLYSKHGAMQTAANWTIPIAALAGLLVGFRAHTGRMSSSRAAIYSLALLFTTAMTMLVVYFTLPKVAIRLQRWPGVIAQTNLRQTALSSVTSYPTNQPVDLGSVRQHIGSILALRDLRWRENVLLGGDIREEDSPGNYTLRETADGVEIIGYDTTGAGVPLGLIPKPKSP